MVGYWWVYRGGIGNPFMLCILIALLYIPILLILAWYNAVLIRKGKRIYHFWNGLLHCVVAGGVWVLDSWQSGLAVLFIARVVFDTALNLMRGLPIDYVPKDPKSIVDKLEKKVFGNNGIIPKIIYIIIIAALLIF